MSTVGPWIQVKPGVRRRVVGVGSTMLSQEVLFEPGGEVDVHTHEHEQISYVVRASLAFRLGDREFQLRQGDTLVIPSNVPHGCRALEASLAYDVFHPVRQDYVAEMHQAAGATA